jgi:lipoprotein-releasing system ATP-binding protein
LDRPSAGRVRVGGQDLFALNETQRGHLRNRALGFVYQFHHLLPEFSALENVAMPLLIRGEPVPRARERAADILQRVGLDQRLAHKPGELSGGERQRAAMARALVTAPDCVLADEPTGNLDQQTGETVIEILFRMNSEYGTTLVLVSHDLALAKRCDRIIQMEAGHIVKQEPVNTEAGV